MWDDWMEVYAKKNPVSNAHAILVSRAVIKRTEMGLSQEELAKKIGISCRKIKKFEDCQNIDLFDLLTICTSLDIRVGE